MLYDTVIEADARRRVLERPGALRAPFPRTHDRRRHRLARTLHRVADRIDS